MSKKTLIWLGVISGLLAVGGLILWLYRDKIFNRGKTGNEMNADDVKEFTEDANVILASDKPANPPKSYSPTEIRAMQIYMYVKGNASVRNAIKDSGGIDGVRGAGFNKALALMVSLGRVSSIDDLYKKTWTPENFKLAMEWYNNVYLPSQKSSAIGKLKSSRTVEEFGTFQTVPVCVDSQGNEFPAHSGCPTNVSASQCCALHDAQWTGEYTQ